MKYSKLSNTSFTATMKHLFLMAFAILTIGCGEKKSEDVNLDELEDREGVAYLKNSDSPYTGKVFEFHDNGQKKSETTLKDGKPDGLSEAWFENGQKKSEANYKDGKQDGHEVTWYDNGQKQAEITLKDGKEDGLSEAWFENGQKEVEGNYKDGKLHGPAVTWYENGQKEAEYNNKDGKLHGPAVSWYENGQKEAEENYKDGEYDGLSGSWYENGQKEAEGNYKDGKIDGPAVTWYENGQKEGEVNYKDGKLISKQFWNSKGEEVDSKEEAETSGGAEKKISVEKPVIDINEAVAAKDLKTVRQHITYGSDINLGNSFGITPLHWASGNQESGEITELLLKHGANVDAERTDGATPMHHATYYNKIKSVEALLRYGANLEARDRSQFGATPLHEAAWRSDTQIVELLIAAGADVNSLDLKNQTPLDLAILHKNEGNMKTLLKYKGQRKEDLEKLLTLSVDGVEVTAKRIIKDFPQFEYFHIASTGAFSLDELRIGKTYDSVTGDPSANDPNIIFSDSFEYLEGEKLVYQKGWRTDGLSSNGSKSADCYTIHKGSLISDEVKSAGNRLSSDATDTMSTIQIEIPDKISFEDEDSVYLSFLMRPEGAIGVGRWGGYFLVGAKPLGGKGILFGKPGSNSAPDDGKYAIDRQGGPHIVTSGVQTEVDKTSFVVVKMESNASGKKVSELKPHAVQFSNLEERKGIRYLKNSDTPYTGKFFHIHSNGQKRATGDFKDGKPEGLMTYWYKNGQREMEGAFKGGKRNGQVIWWHENGQKKGEANFKDSEAISEKYWNSKGEEVDSLAEAE